VQIWGPQAPDIEHGPVEIVDLPIENGDFPGYPKNSPSSFTVDFPMPNADFPVRKLSTFTRGHHDASEEAARDYHHCTRLFNGHI